MCPSMSTNPRTWPSRRTESLLVENDVYSGGFGEGLAGEGEALGQFVVDEGLVLEHPRSALFHRADTGAAGGFPADVRCVDPLVQQQVQELRSLGPVESMALPVDFDFQYSVVIDAASASRSGALRTECCCLRDAFERIVRQRPIVLTMH